MNVTHALNVMIFQIYKYSGTQIDLDLQFISLFAVLFLMCVSIYVLLHFASDFKIPVADDSFLLLVFSY